MEEGSVTFQTCPYMCKISLCLPDFVCVDKRTSVHMSVEDHMSAPSQHFQVTVLEVPITVIIVTCTCDYMHNC